MHEIVFHTDKYKIIGYLKNSTGSLISIPKCVEIRTDIIGFVLKDFKSSENLFFSKICLSSYDNLLYMVIIEYCHLKNIRQVLNKLWPSVFDLKKIKIINKSIYLYNNRYLIKKLAINILGAHKIIEDMWKEINQKNWSFDDDIFNEENIIQSDEIIEF